MTSHTAAAKLNTAEARTAARAAERDLRWLDAAALLDHAVAVYPMAGALADHDKGKMLARAASFRATARAEAA